MVSPNGLPIVCVSRPGKWGNPYAFDPHQAVSPERKAELRAASIQKFERTLLGRTARRVLGFAPDDVARELRGKNLAWGCPLDESCHADVLLAIANRKPKSM